MVCPGLTAKKAGLEVQLKIYDRMSKLRIPRTYWQCFKWISCTRLTMILNSYADLGQKECVACVNQMGKAVLCLKKCLPDKIFPQILLNTWTSFLINNHYLLSAKKPTTTKHNTSTDTKTFQKIFISPEWIGMKLTWATQLILRLPHPSSPKLVTTFISDLFRKLPRTINKDRHRWW